MKVIAWVAVVVPLVLVVAFIFGGRFLIFLAGGWSVSESLKRVFFFPVIALVLWLLSILWRRMD